MRLADLVPEPHGDQELVAPPGDRFYVRSLDDDESFCSEWSDAASHVTVVSVEYLLEERFFTPCVISIDIHLPAGEIRDRQRAIDDFYEVLRDDAIPPDIMNYDLSIGPRYVEGIERGERVTSVTTRPANAVFYPRGRVRTTPIGAVRLSVQVNATDTTVDELLGYYDDAIIRLTRHGELGNLTAVDQATDTAYAFVTDADRPCLIEPQTAPGPNHIDLH